MTTESTPTTGAIAALGAAVLLGATADYLLRGNGGPGLNIPLLGMIFQGLLLSVRHRSRTPVPPASLALVILANCFLLSFVLRDSPALNAMAFMAATVSLGLAAWIAQGAVIRQATVMHYLVGLARGAVGVAVGVLPLAFYEADWSAVSRKTPRSQLWRLSRGVAFAIPPVVVFGALFAGADPIFGRLYQDIFRFDLAEVLSHVVVTGIIAWAAAGLLREFIVPRPAPESLGGLAGGRWAHLEVMVVLGGVTLVFLAFVIVQIRVLFGGDAFVQSRTGLTYAQYARDGFFHMIGAAALVLPLLLFLEWIGRREKREQMVTFRALATVLLLLLGVVLFSAIDRMRVYQQNYGLTELRFYTFAFMAWLVPALIWFGMTVLAGRRERFPGGALLLGFALIAALHVLNPDAIIARTNLDRLKRGGSYDASYAATLSADAAPVLIDGGVVADSPLRCRYATRWARGRGDWRSWNLSRWRATQRLEAMDPEYKVGCSPERS